MTEQTLDQQIKTIEVSGQLKEPDVDQAVKVYIKIRDKRAENSKAFELEDARLKEQQEQIENFLLETMQRAGNVTKLGTAHGTAYAETETQFSIADDSIFYTFMQERGALDMLQRRISTNVVKTYMKENDGALPPGLSIFNRQRVKIRRT